MATLILADGETPSRADLDRGWPGWAHDIGFVIAADGGARHAGPLGVTIDLWVGDGDSLGEAGITTLAAAGVAIERAPTDKDESDTDLAVRAAVRHDAKALIILGALGGRRVDHALANLTLLASPGLADRDVVIYGGHSSLRLVRGAVVAGRGRPVALTGIPGDLVSLLPVGADVVGVTTIGLRFPLADEPLLEGSTRGLSNVVAAADAGLEIRNGSLLVIESPATLDR